MYLGERIVVYYWNYWNYWNVGKEVRPDMNLSLSIKKRSTFERRLWAAAGPYCPKDWGL